MPYIVTAAVVLIAIVVDYVIARRFFENSIVMHREELKVDLSESRAIPAPGWAEHLPAIKENSKWLREQSMERLSVESRDGLRLAGYWYPAENALRTVLFFHGYKSNPWWDASGLGRYLHEHGCNILFADQRAHGESEGKYICFGVKERLDCLTWLDYMDRRFGTEKPLYLMGLSMGASTVLMAAGETLPENVRGVMGDCGFTSAYDEFKHTIGIRSKIPAWLVLPMAGLITRAKAGFGLKECSTPRALARTKLPVLLIHGGSDNFVPTRMSREAFEACGSEKRLLIVEKAPHALSYFYEPQRYLQAVEEFFEKHDLVNS